MFVLCSTCFYGVIVYRDYVSAHSQTMEMSQVLETEQIVRMGSSSMSGTWARSGSIKTAL